MAACVGYTRRVSKDLLPHTGDLWFAGLLVLPVERHLMSELNKFMDLYHRSVEAFIQGDPDVQKPLWSAGDDVTLANPLGPPVKGVHAVWQHLDHAASLISGGHDYTFASIAVVETADLAYEVGIERNIVTIGAATDEVPISLRVTTVFRREDGEWKIVHRHADPITEERSVQSLAQRAEHPSQG